MGLEKEPKFDILYELYWDVAQLAEQVPLEHKVKGSSPFVPVKHNSNKKPPIIWWFSVFKLEFKAKMIKNMFEFSRVTKVQLDGSLTKTDP